MQEDDPPLVQEKHRILLKKLERSQYKQGIIDKNTFECFCIISITEDESYRSYLKRDDHWIQVQGLRANKVEANFIKSLSVFPGAKEIIMYQFFRKIYWRAIEFTLFEIR